MVEKELVERKLGFDSEQRLEETCTAPLAYWLTTREASDWLQRVRDESKRIRESNQRLMTLIQPRQSIKST